ncbi:uncharacterized protein A4U43_C09F12210, partial [Asparagus officinalis]
STIGIDRLLSEAESYAYKGIGEGGQGCSFQGFDQRRCAGDSFGPRQCYRLLHSILLNFLGLTITR